MSLTFLSNSIVKLTSCGTGLNSHVVIVIINANKLKLCKVDNNEMLLNLDT
jgi:hypothetical protein